MAHPRRVILVTGMPRSGTTPCGSNLELARGARHLYEPFNPGYGMEGISRHYEVPGANGFTVERLDAAVEAIRCLTLRLKRYYNPGEVRGRLIKWLFGDRARLAYWRCRLDPSVETIIWKDPNACFTAAAVADRHGIPVVVTVRPAAAVVASFKRMDWDPGLPQVLGSLAQVGITFPELLAEYGGLIESRTVAAAMLWSVIYSTLLEWAETRPLIRLVDLQKTIERPTASYQDLFQWLKLPWSPEVADGLRRRYPQEKGAGAPAAPLPQRAHVRQRSLSEVNTYGSRLLTLEERAVIEAMTGELWARLQRACIAGPQSLPPAAAAEAGDRAGPG